MNRRALLAALLAAPDAPAGDEPEPIIIDVGPGKRVTVTVPDIRKADLVDIVAGFFSRGDEAAKAKFESLIDQAPTLTLILKSRP